MTCLVVIGKTGQVASELCRLELPSGWTLLALDRSCLDLCKPSTFADILLPLQPSAIINAAAYTAVDKAECEADLAFRVNGDAPGELARISAELDVPFLHVSTDYVFDGTGYEPWKESCPTSPINVYGASKLAGEQAVLASGARSIALRTSWVFSSFGNNFVKTMLRLAQDKSELSVVADQRGGPTPAADIAKTLLEMAIRLTSDYKAATGIFHYSGQPDVSWADFAETIFRQADWLDQKPVIHRISTDQYPTPARRPIFSLLNCEKIKQEHGIEQPDWRLGLECVLREIRKPNTAGALS